MVDIFYVASVVFYVAMVAAIVLAFIYKYRTDNRLEYGAAICTKLEAERFPEDLFRRWMYKMRKKNGLICLRKFYGHRGTLLPGRQIEELSRKLIQDICADIKKKYPDAAKYVDEIPGLFIQSDHKALNMARKDYNATSYDFGYTGLSYAYAEQYILAKEGKSKYTQDEMIDMIAYILLHEAAHHDFRLKPGFHLFHRPSAQLMHHVNEYYADMKAYYIMGMTSDEATLNQERVIKLKKNHDIYKTFFTHPSDYDRLSALEEGSFDIFRVAAAGSAINLSKNRTYVKIEDVDFVNGKIKEFKEKHPEIEMDIELN